MKIEKTRDEEKITNVAMSVANDPQSWKDWMVLHIETPNLTEDIFKDVASSAGAVIESYMTDVKGAAYFCRNRDVYIFCKNISEQVLDQVCAQIYELVLRDIKETHNKLYKLTDEAEAFAAKIFADFDMEYIPPTDQAQATTTGAGFNYDEGEYKHRTKVMLVEDDPVIRWMVRNSVKEFCDFVCAENATKVFSAYASNRPDIVFLDIGLPDNSGKEVLDWIVGQDPSACVIMMSGKDDVENISNCMEQGAKGFIPKPFVKEDLLRYIQKYG